MSKDSTTKTSNNTTGASSGSATTLANANSLWNLGMQNVNNPAPSYGGDLTTGLSPDQQAAFGLIRGAGQAGVGALNGAVSSANAAANFQPGTISAAQAGVTQAAGVPSVANGLPMVDANGGAVTAPTIAGGPMAHARDVSTSTLPETDLSKYMDPYNNDVIDASVKAIQRQQGQANAQLTSQQAAGGAFGDSRSGVQAALQNSLFDENTQSTIAGLKSDSFKNAQAQAQTDLARKLQASGMNQGADVATSTTNANVGAQVGIANGNLGLAARTATAGNNLTAMIANANNALSGRTTDANIGAGLSEFNAGAANSGAQFNTGQTNTVAGTNVGNSLTGNAQRLAGAGTLGNLGMQQQSQVLNQANAQGAAGAVEQNTQQAGLTAAYNDFLRKQGYSQQQIQNLMGIFNSTAPATGMQSTSTSAGTETTPHSLIPSLIGAATGVGSILFPGAAPILGAVGKAIG